MTLRALAHAKVNLHLEVLHERQDGYHEIETILQSIELHDRLWFEATSGPIHVRCDHPSVPRDRTNLCHRAAKLLRGHLGVERGARITLEKNIPVAAGLGGGSADAAACLVALPVVWGIDVDPDVLRKVASRLGADVPFFLQGGTQLGRGIGDELTPISSSGEGWYLVVTPRLELSTAWVYGRLRMGLTRVPPKVNLQNYKSLLSRFPERSWPGFNRLGDVVFTGFPSLNRLYSDLRGTHPRLAMLSGSGPSLFAVYSSLDQAERALESLKQSTSIGSGDFAWIGRSTRRGVTLVRGQEGSPDR